MRSFPWNYLNTSVWVRWVSLWHTKSCTPSTIPESNSTKTESGIACWVARQLGAYFKRKWVASVISIQILHGQNTLSMERTKPWRYFVLFFSKFITYFFLLLDCLLKGWRQSYFEWGCGRHWSRESYCCHTDKIGLPKWTGSLSTRSYEVHSRTNHVDQRCSGIMNSFILNLAIF